MPKITWTQVSNPQWANAAQTSVLVNVNWSTVGYVTRSLLQPEDSSPNIQGLLAEVLAGNYGAISAYAPPPPPTAQEIYEQQVAAATAERRRLISTYVAPYSGDILTWGDLSAGQRQQVTSYRSQLMAIESQPGYPANITWPAPPQFN